MINSKERNKLNFFVALIIVLFLSTIMMILSLAVGADKIGIMFIITIVVVAIVFNLTSGFLGSTKD